MHRVIADHFTAHSLCHLVRQVQQYRQLSRLVQPYLPAGSQWQVACYQNGVLTLSNENQALVCQVRYLQQHYIHRLKNLDTLKDLQRLSVITSGRTIDLHTNYTQKNMPAQQNTARKLQSEV